MKSWTKTKFFPFSPGIPWQLRNSRYVIPQLDRSIWDRVVYDKELVIACYGGLLESFFSLSYIEAFSKIFPSKRLTWLGNQKFNYLINAQSLATISNLNIDESDLEGYPVPLFFTKANHAIFNCLNNYLIKQTYYKKKNFPRHELILNQIFQNSLIEWAPQYLPKIRNNQLEINKFNNWLQSQGNNFSLTHKYILIFSDDIGSLHNSHCLDWNEREIKELAALVRRFGYKVIVACKPSNFRKYFGHQNLMTISVDDLSFVVRFIQSANIILSKNVDYLFLGIFLSKAKIISTELPKRLDLVKNSEFCDIRGDICILKEDISPMDVYNFCNEGLNG